MASSTYAEAHGRTGGPAQLDCGPALGVLRWRTIMISLDQDSEFSALCKALKKWGISVDFCGSDSLGEIFKACPFLDAKVHKHVQMLIDGHGVFLFDTRDEMERHYRMIVGDDGPTDLNPYDGLVRVYALTCNPNGLLLNENT